MKAVDLFAGAGGFTLGALDAGISVTWAANHWPMAVATHTKNHPETQHSCQDLQQANWLEVPAHDLMMASPACQGHSRARGQDKPHHDAARSTAWAVVEAAECHRPPVVLVENVAEFLSWTLFPAWQNAMESLGYSLATHIVDSADHGVPQHRVRVFIVCTKSKSPLRLRLPRRDHTFIGSSIEWDRYSWSKINKPGRSRNTLLRARNGRASFGDRFVMPFYGSGSGKTGRSIDRPLGTVTTRDRWAVVDGDRMRMLQPSEYRSAMGFPVDYWLPPQRATAIHLLGNAVVPRVATDIITAIHSSV